LNAGVDAYDHEFRVQSVSRFAPVATAQRAEIAGFEKALGTFGSGYAGLDHLNR